MMDKNVEAFVVYITFLSLKLKTTIYLARKT